MSITLTLGVMTSGKTSALLELASRLNSISLKALFVNHSFDTRNVEEISTHNPLLVWQQKLPNITFLKLADLEGLDVTDYHSILIDEGQFFENLVSAVVKFKKAGKHVHVAGLIGDFKRQPIGHILELIPLCDNPASDVKFSTAYCKFCAEETQQAVPACASFKLDRRDKKQIAIGGTNKYAALCCKHYDASM